MRKIVGVGLNKTGTKTLGACLTHWGLNCSSHDRANVVLWKNGCYPELLDIVDSFDGFEDWPWPLIYKEIYMAYSDAKFILTRRSSSEVWFESLCRHAEKTGPTKTRKDIYGYEMPHEHKQEHIAFYEKHNSEVRSYFKDKPDRLIEVCWEEGRGWCELAEFLGFDVPSIPFPHENINSSVLDELKNS